MPIEKEQFLEQFSKQALDERISLFLGAGGSCDAGYPTWSSLFEPLAKELKISAVSDLMVNKAHLLSDHDNE